MKNIICLLIALFISKSSFSQDYLKDIAKKTCECVGKITDGLSEEQYNMEFGLCMLQASGQYKKELKKDFNIDLIKIDEQAEELGRIIGVAMLDFCPDVLMKLVNNSSNEISTNSTQGEITAIDENKFVEFSIKDKSGKILKYYWLTFIESNIEISSNYKNLKNKVVYIEYVNDEFFDPRINEYKMINIIKKINVLE